MPVNVQWCLRQSKGIHFIEPAPSVALDYIKKARIALSVADMSLHGEALEWVMIATYYARYESAYALLMQTGIKSEIHECTIMLLRELFVKHQVISPHHGEEIERSKQERIDAQYYVKTPVLVSEAQKTLQEAREFVLEMETALERLTQEVIRSLRQDLDALINPAKS